MDILVGQGKDIWSTLWIYWKDKGRTYGAHYGYIGRTREGHMEHIMDILVGQGKDIWSTLWIYW